MDYNTKIRLLEQQIRELKNQQELEQEAKIKAQFKINIIAYYATEEEGESLVAYLRDKLEIYPYFVGAYKKYNDINSDVIIATNTHEPDFIWEDE